MTEVEMRGLDKDVKPTMEPIPRDSSRCSLRHAHMSRPWEQHSMCSPSAQQVFLPVDLVIDGQGRLTKTRLSLHISTSCELTSQMIIFVLISHL